MHPLKSDNTSPVNFWLYLIALIMFDFFLLHNQTQKY
jgi:hypothetical protein